MRRAEAVLGTSIICIADCGTSIRPRGARKGAERINRKLKRALEPGSRLFFLLLAAFASASAFFNWYLAAAEGAAIVIVYLFYRRQVIRRRRDIVRYIDQIAVNVDTATKDSVVNFPLPMVIIRLDTGEMVWGNERFFEAAGQREHLFEVRLSDIIPGLDARWLLEGRSESPAEITLRGRQYSVLGTSVRSGGARSGRGLLATLYFVDTTELNWLRRERALSRPAVCVVLMDNYDECMKNASDSQKSSLLAAIDKKVSDWAEPIGGILRKFDRDKYLFFFEERHLAGLVEKHFCVLDEVRSLHGATGVPVTLSIGIGREGADFSESFSFAQLSIDMALSRGGDQAVIKNKFNFEFYGGRSKELEKRAKVKSRVMAATLARLMSDSSRIFVMGHTGADIDALGSAAGVVRIARKCGREAYIVLDEKRCLAGPLLERLRAAPEYAGVFINDQDALIKADNNSLLVVTDCNRPDIVDSPELLKSMGRVAVIDHHRRAAEYIENAAFNFHEPFASSASELVCELLQYVCQPGDLLRVEAEALLGGIVLDTKNFSMNTGTNTFEAAAWLRGAGADTVSIKKLFQTDLRSSLDRYGIIVGAQMIRDGIAVAAVEKQVDRTVTARAADELLGIEGVEAAFVVSRSGDFTVISARSLGAVNVQVICERLGGGGHLSMAGAQLRGVSVTDAVSRLTGAINLYFEEVPQ